MHILKVTIDFKCLEKKYPITLFYEPVAAASCIFVFYVLKKKT